jgi:septal ring factor EnvC (AmiA/AmiB activator)
MDRVFPFIKTIFKIISAFFLLWLLVAAPLPCAGKQTDAFGVVTATATPALDTLTQKARHVDAKLGKKEKEVASFSEQEAKIIDALDQLESSLNTAEKNTAALEKEVAGLTTELKKAESNFNALEKEVKALEVYASRRLVSFYKLSRMGTLPLMVSAESLFDLLTRKKNFERLLAQDESVWKTLLLKRTAAGEAQKELQRQRQRHQTKLDELESQIRSLSRRKAERTALLAAIKGKKALALASIASLKEAAVALDRQILEASRIPPEPPPPREAPPSPGEAPPSPKEAPPAEKRAADEFKGLLNMPVNGTITSFFGSYTLPHLNVPGFRNGIDIQAPIGEPIRAVKGGTTLFAGWFKGYGNMVILDHGDSYCTVYTHAQELFKKKGEAVTPGEVIGTVGDTGSLDGPKLHFEIRHHGKPIDPLKWMEKRSKNEDDKTEKR